jgi:6-pyruvoyltetrahydropterin/6-carboxytetrahydropterin synthase
MRIVKSVSFDAAHFLPEAGAESPYARMHGHSFVLEVAIEGEPDANHGWVVDFAAVADALSALRERLDHHLLNSIEGLERPTLENICLWAARELRPQLKGLVHVKISRPSIGESCVFDVRG